MKILLILKTKITTNWFALLLSAQALRACVSYVGSLQCIWDELPNISRLEKFFISTFPNVDVFNNKFGPINLIDSAPEWPARPGKKCK